ncbi:MAG: HPF/RaiA family ribosome-associated protein [Bacteroidales bacterium]|nr:HPF/RaiA family ribosome-associated protein [Bacteroidales bacterium]
MRVLTFIPSSRCSDILLWRQRRSIPTAASPGLRLFMNKPIQGQKKEVKMEIRVQSIKFNADQKLLDFVEKKFSRLEKFYDAVTAVDVALSLLPDHENKNVKVQVSIPGNNLVVEKNAKTFEDAVVDCADILKEKLVKVKERRAE